MKKFNSNNKNKASKADKAGKAGAQGLLAVNKPAKPRAPKVRSEGECVVITHSELFDWPLGKLAFTVNVSMSVNPGVSTVFPWLSGVANNFETYRFRRLRFVYYPRCAATQAGQAIMLLDPKSGDGNPRTLQIASSYHIRTNGNMWAPMSLDIPREVLSTGGPRRFVRSSIIDSVSASLYDVGRFCFITDGANPFDAVVGELGVEYEVELWTPASRPTGPVPAMFVNGVATGATALNLFGNSPFASGLLFDEMAANVIAMKDFEITGLNQATEYGLWLVLGGTAITAVTAVFSSGTIVNTFGPLANPTNTTVMTYWTFRPNGAVGTVSFTVTATTITDANMTVAQLPYDIDF